MKHRPVVRFGSNLFLLAFSSVVVATACQAEDGEEGEGPDAGGAGGGGAVDGAGGADQETMGGSGPDAGATTGSGGDGGDDGDGACSPACGPDQGCRDGACIDRSWTTGAFFSALDGQVRDPVVHVHASGDAVIVVLNPNSDEVGYVTLDWDTFEVSEPVWFAAAEGQFVARFNSRGEGFVAVPRSDSTDVYFFDPETGFAEGEEVIDVDSAELDGAMTEEGRAFLVYRTPIDDVLRMKTSTAPGEAFGPAVTLGNDVQSGPRFAVNDAGDAIVGWSDDEDAWARRLVDGIWLDAEVVSELSTFSGAPHVALSEEGDALAVFEEHSEVSSPTSVDHLHFAVFDGEAWSEPASFGALDIDEHAFAFDSRGGAAVVYQSIDPDDAAEVPRRISAARAFDWESLEFGAAAPLGTHYPMGSSAVFLGPNGIGVVSLAGRDADDDFFTRIHVLEDGAFSAPIEIMGSPTRVHVDFNARGDAVGAFSTGADLGAFRNLPWL